MKIIPEKDSKATEKQPERKQKFQTDIGIDIKPLYTPSDLSETEFDYHQDLGQPGQYPFTRGISPGMYRSQPWMSRAYAGQDRPADPLQLSPGREDNHQRCNQ